MERAVTWVDAAALSVYFIAILLVGVRAGRRGTSDFLIAERKLSPLASAASICASKIGAGVFLTHIAYVYLYGAAAMSAFVGVTVGYIAFFFFAGRLKQLADEGNYFTLSDFLVDRFGPPPGYASAVALFITYVLGLAGQLVGGAKILATLTGVGYGVGLTLMSALIIGYIMIGGFAAVVRTDVLQYGAILVLTAILAFSLVRAQPESWAQIESTSSPSVSVALFFGATLVPFAAGDMWQRVYATQGRVEARRSLLYAIIMYVSFGVLLTGLGLLVRTMLPDADPDMALINAFELFLPAGLIGAAGVVVYAALMSSADTNLYTASSILVQDLHSRVAPPSSPELVVSRIRVVALVVGVLALLVALLIPELVRLGFLYLGMYASIGAIVLVAILHRRARAGSLAAGLVGGTIATLIGFVLLDDERLIFLGAGVGLSLTLVAEIAARLVSRRTRPKTR